MDNPARAPAPSDPAWDWADLRLRARGEARRLLADPHEAEDAVQEAMLRAWRQRLACRSPEAPESWLRQIARNEAFRLHTRAAARGEQPLPEESAEAEEQEDGLVERLFLDDAFGRLRSEDRALVLLRYKLDLPDVAIAELLGIAESTVRVRFHRLKKHLRVLIGDT